MVLQHGATRGLALIAILGLTACAGDTNPVRDMFVAVGAGGVPAQAPEFVDRSRPADLTYVPVGSAKPGRSTPARTAADVQAAEAELDALRARNEAEAEALRRAAAGAPR